MSVEAHIQQLKQKHQLLETELANLSASPSVSDMEVAQVKRKKLQLKDEIHRLETA